jgi:hypothetical protein
MKLMLHAVNRMEEKHAPESLVIRDEAEGP